MTDADRATCVFSLIIGFTIGFTLCLLWLGWHALLPGFTLNEAYSSHWILWVLLWFIVGFEFLRRRQTSTRLYSLISMVLVAASVAILAVTLLLPSLEWLQTRLQTTGAWNSVLVGIVSSAIFFVPGFLMGAVSALGLSMTTRGSTAQQRLFIACVLLGCFAAFTLAWTARLSFRQLCFVASLPSAGVGIAFWFKMAGRVSSSPQLFSMDPGEDDTLPGSVAASLYGFTFVVLVAIWLKVNFYVGGSVLPTYGIGLMALSLGLFLGAVLSVCVRRKYFAHLCSIVSALGFAVLASRWQAIVGFSKTFPFKEAIIADARSATIFAFLPGILGGITLTQLAVPKTDFRRHSPRYLESAIGGISAGILASSFLPNSHIGIKIITSWLPLAFVGVGAILLFGNIRRLLYATTIGAVLALTAILAILGPQWKMQFTAGIHAFGKNGLPELVYYRESPESITAVTRTPYRISIWQGGNILASMPQDLIGEVLSAHIPLLLHKNPRRILIVGGSTGTVLNSVEKYDVDKIISVGFQRDLLEASNHFRYYNQSPFENTRLEIRSAKLSWTIPATKQIDVTILDYLPRTFPFGKQEVTTEMIRMAKSVMAPDGIVAQRFSLLEASGSSLRSAAMTFASEFPFVQVWLAGPRHLLFLGSNHPIQASIELIANRMIEMPVGEDLGRIGVEDPAAVLNCYLMGKDGILKFAAGAPLVSKTNPIIARIPVAHQRYPQVLEQIVKSAQDPLSIVSVGAANFQNLRTNISDCRTSLVNFIKAISMRSAGKDHAATAMIEEAIKGCGSSGMLSHFLSDYYVEIASRLEVQKRKQEAASVARRAIDMNPHNPIAFYQLARVQTDTKMKDDLLGRSIDLNPYYASAYILKAETDISNGKIDDGLEAISKILSIEPFNEHASYLRALALIRKNQFGDANRILEDVLRRKPDFLEAEEALAYVSILEGNLDAARRLYHKLAQEHPRNVSILNNYATVVAEQGDYNMAIKIWQQALRIEPENPDIKANIEEARSKIKAD